MLEPLIYICIGFVLASIAWFFYYKLKHSNQIDRSLLDDKESLINARDLTIKEKDGEILAFQKEIKDEGIDEQANKRSREGFEKAMSMLD